MKTRIVPTYVVSDNIDCIGYQLGKLFIRFKSGAAYAYDGCPYTYFDALQKVESAGKFFHSFIRSKLHYTKLETDPFSPAQ
jgi:hypothetical protein